jgi:sugar phosphate isomerase/epimerase
MATLDDIDIMSRLPVDFLELLVRKQDRPEDIKNFLSRFDGEVILHAPEMLGIGEGSVLLDLAGEDGVRAASVARLQQIADAARDNAAAVVLHPGGVHEKAEEPGPLLERLEESLTYLDGYFWMENMPRHYHWRGRLLHANLMRDADQMLLVQRLVDGFVLDTSHAFLSREKDGNLALREMIDQLGDTIRHVHLSDAAYPDQEGLALGTGDLDLTAVPRGRGLPILLEIQGGHENMGAGFREALRFIGRKA